VGWEWIRLGVIYPYVNNVAVYLCPADHSFIGSFGVQFPHVRSMSMNTWMSPVGGLPYNGDPVISYYKEADLVNPGAANLWVFIDENPISINDGSFICDPLIQQWVDCPATYHNNAGGISFADGHALIKKWTDPAILVDWNKQVSPGNPGYVRLSPEETPPASLTYLQLLSTVHQ
jgi:prepilin-type processing-associated H-X9-DG protein